MISNLDIEREVAKGARRIRSTTLLPNDGEVTHAEMVIARDWINLIDRIRYEAEQMNDSASTRDARYDAEQTLDGQTEERPF